MSRFPDALHWRSACVIDPVLKAWDGSWSVSFAVRCGETATHFAFANGVITGVDGAAQFTLSAPAPIWEKFLQPIPPRHHHSIFAMHRQVPEFRIEGDELAFAQHCHIARRVLEIGKWLALGNAAPAPVTLRPPASVSSRCTKAFVSSVTFGCASAGRTAMTSASALACTRQG